MKYGDYLGYNYIERLQPPTGSSKYKTSRALRVNSNLFIRLPSSSFTRMLSYKYFGDSTKCARSYLTLASNITWLFWCVILYFGDSTKWSLMFDAGINYHLAVLGCHRVPVEIANREILFLNSCISAG